MEIISIIIGITSVILAVFAIWFAMRESRKSDENYHKTKDVLAEIDKKAEVIDRTVQIHQEHLVSIINTALSKIGQTPIEFQPATKDEIEAILNDEPILVEIQNKVGGNTAIIGKSKDIGTAIQRELVNERRVVE